MIDNRLKDCCYNCGYEDVFTNESQTYIRRKVHDRTENIPVNRITIGCKHMYVCKAYIENQEAEEVDMSLERKTMKEIMENIEKNGRKSAFRGGKIPEFRKGGTLDC